MSTNAVDYINECKRCLGCAKPRCVTGCPVGNDIPHFLKTVARGDLEGAVRLIGHPFGEICGYVCPCEQQCQGNCVLAHKNGAVTTGMVERRVFAEQPYAVRRLGSLAEKCKIAVVGGGVSGLTFAVKMYEQGADVTVFESKQLLSTLKLIPPFRLPREAIARVEEELKNKFDVVKELVDAEKLCSLTRGYDAVYLATGASEEYNLGIDGDFATPYSVFLSEYGNFEAHKGALQGTEIVVIGGGNTAMDCARLAAKCGSEVTVAYRRTRADMPAFVKEIAEADGAGVKFVYNVAPVAIMKNGDALTLTLAETECEGRGKLTVSDRTHELRCDKVVAALGSRFDKSILSVLQANGELPTNLYTGGDAAGGKLVSTAVADALTQAKRFLATLKV